MARRIVIALTGGALLLLLAPAPAVADDCVALPALCPDGAIDVEPDDVLDDPVGTIVETLEGADDTTDPVVDPIVDTVEDVLGGGGVVVEPPGQHGPADHGTKPPVVDDVRGRGGTNATGPAEPTTVGPTALGREAVRPIQTLIGAAASDTRPAVRPDGTPGRPGGIDTAVRGLLLLAVLFGLTIGFVLVQNRLDRHDRTLELAPVRADVVEFG